MVIMPPIYLSLKLPHRRLSYARGKYVYVAYDINDKVLYVGSTKEYSQRLNGHRSNSLWYPQAVRCDIYDIGDGYKDVEATLINEWRPSFNRYRS